MLSLRCKQQHLLKSEGLGFGDFTETLLYCSVLRSDLGRPKKCPAFFSIWVKIGHQHPPLEGPSGGRKVDIVTAWVTLSWPRQVCSIKHLIQTQKHFSSLCRSLSQDLQCRENENSRSQGSHLTLIFLPAVHMQWCHTWPTVQAQAYACISIEPPSYKRVTSGRLCMEADWGWHTLSMWTWVHGCGQDSSAGPATVRRKLCINALTLRTFYCYFLGLIKCDLAWG